MEGPSRDVKKPSQSANERHIPFLLQCSHAVFKMTTLPTIFVQSEFSLTSHERFADWIKTAKLMGKMDGDSDASVRKSTDVASGVRTYTLRFRLNGRPIAHTVSFASLVWTALLPDDVQLCVPSSETHVNIQKCVSCATHIHIEHPNRVACDECIDSAFVYLENEDPSVWENKSDADIDAKCIAFCRLNGTRFFWRRHLKAVKSQRSGLAILEHGINIV